MSGKIGLLSKEIAIEINGKNEILSSDKMNFVKLENGSKLKISKKLLDVTNNEDLIVVKNGENLEIFYSDGSSITLEGFYALTDVSLELPTGENESHLLSSNLEDTLVETSVVYAQGDMSKFISLLDGNETLSTALNNYNHSLSGMNAGDAIAAETASATAGEAGASTGVFAGLSQTAMLVIGGVVVAGAAIAIGSSGGSSSDSSSGSSSDSSSGSSSSTGYLVDSAVGGVDYYINGATTPSGKTGADGSFSYKAGDTITFKIGNITLGSIKSSEVPEDGNVFPQDIILGPGKRSEITDPKVTEMLKFLQTLDSDGIADNGININADSLALINPDSTINFEDGGKVLDAIDTSKTLAKFEEYKAKLEASDMTKDELNTELAKYDSSTGILTDDAANAHVLATARSLNEAPKDIGTRTFNGYEDLSTLIAKESLLSNIVDANGDALDISNVTVSSGTIELIGDVYKFTPPANAFGDFTLTYTVTDSFEEELVVHSTINIASTIDNPTSTDGTLTVNEDAMATEFNLPSAVNIEDLGVVYSLGESPTNGTVTVAADGTAVYTPNSDFYGTDSFTFRVSPESAAIESSKLDYVFVIDDTGSMGGTITNVINNVTNFVNSMVDSNLDVNFGFIRYGEYSEGASEFSGFFNADTLSEFVTALNTLDANGGGDGPESGLEALMNLSSLEFRDTAVKKALLLTDITVKDLANGYEYYSGPALYSMDETIAALRAANITVDVAGTSYEYPDEAGSSPTFQYQQIAYSTGGEVSNVNDSLFYSGGFGILDQFYTIEITVNPLNDLTTGGVTITYVDDVPTIGSTLTANTSELADIEGLGTFSYMWFRDGDFISGATGETYTVTSDDENKSITVTVTHTDGAGTPEHITSIIPISVGTRNISFDAADIGVDGADVVTQLLDIGDNTQTTAVTIIGAISLSSANAIDAATSGTFTYSISDTAQAISTQETADNAVLTNATTVTATTVNGDDLTLLNLSNVDTISMADGAFIDVTLAQEPLLDTNTSGKYAINLTGTESIDTSGLEAGLLDIYAINGTENTIYVSIGDVFSLSREDTNTDGKMDLFIDGESLDTVNISGWLDSGNDYTDLDSGNIYSIYTNTTNTAESVMINNDITNVNIIPA